MAAMQQVATDLVSTQPAMTAGGAQQAATEIPEAEQEQTDGAAHQALPQEQTVQDGSCNVVKGVLLGPRTGKAAGASHNIEILPCEGLLMHLIVCAPGFVKLD